jgi:hypothetical protein
MQLPTNATQRNATHIMACVVMSCQAITLSSNYNKKYYYYFIIPNYWSMIYHHHGMSWHGMAYLGRSANLALGPKLSVLCGTVEFGLFLWASHANE